MIKRVKIEFVRAIREGIKTKLFSDIEKLNESIMEGYDELSSFGYDPDSKSNPELYREEFKARLENFEYFRDLKSGYRFILPSMSNFNFNGISIIEAILEGIPNEYYEVSYNDAKALYLLHLLPSEPISNLEGASGAYYLIDSENPLVTQVKQSLGKNLVKFPFSGVGSLESVVFDSVDKFIQTNNERVSRVVSGVIKTVQSKFG